MRSRWPHPRLAFLCLAVALLGLAPLGMSQTGRLEAPNPAAVDGPGLPPDVGAVDVMAAELELPVMEVRISTDTWVRYLDLAIRLLALIVAWMTAPSSGQTAGRGQERRETRRLES